MPITRLNPYLPNQAFPSVEKALTEPNGLLAYGGCLSVTRLLQAYQLGIFPWYNNDDPILWWSPDPRLVLFPDKLLISSSLKKTLRKQLYQFSYDSVFAQVMVACADPRPESQGTWINDSILAAYQALFAAGHAHSFETWQDQELVGGLYGVAIGRVFFGESMFYKKTDASKVAFVLGVQLLKQWGYQLIDCQVRSAHLLSLGAEEISRKHFQNLLATRVTEQPEIGAWQK